MSLDPMPDDATLLRLAAERAKRLGARSDTAPSAQLIGGSKSSRMVLPAKGRLAGENVRLVLKSVKIVVPLAHCHSDNQRYMVHARRRQLVLTPTYRQAKANAQDTMRRAMGNSPPMTGPVEWHATVYFANNRRDLTNASKMLQDSASKIVFEDDKQIVKAVWERGENDPENPRIEITVKARDA